MQAYDLIMLIVLGMATIFGAIKGFAWQVASLASILVSYIVAYRYRFDVAEMIEAKPPWNQFLAMLILYIGTSFVIWVGFRLVSGMIDKVRLKEFDRHLGAVFGLAKGIIFCLLITMFAMSLLGPNQQAAICQSRSGYYITVALDRGVGVLPKEIHDVVGPYLANLDDKLKQGGSESNVPNGFDEGTSDGLLPGFPNPNGGQWTLPGTGSGLPSLGQSGSGQQPSSGFGQTGSGLSIPGADNWDWRQGAETLSGLNDTMQQLGNGLDSGLDALQGGGGNLLPPQNFPPLNSAPTFNPGAPFNSGVGGANVGAGNNGLRPSGGGLRPNTSQPGLPGGSQQAQQPSGVPRY